MTEGVDQRALQSIVAELARAVESLSRGFAAAQPSSAGEVASTAPESDLLGAVQEILSLRVSTSSAGELFSLTGDRLARWLDVDRVMLFVAEGERLAPRSARGFRHDDLQSIAIAAGEGLVGRAYRENRLLRQDLDPEIADDWFIDRYPVKSAIAVPVRGDDAVAGVLYAGRRVRRAFGSTDALVLLAAAERMGAALREHARAERRSAEISRIRELTRFADDLSVGRGADEILSRACDLGCRVLGVRAAAIAIGADDLDVVAARGLPSAPSLRLSRREGLTAEVCDRNGPVACPDLGARTAREHAFGSEPAWRGCLALPLRCRGLAVGVMYFLDTDVRDFSTEDIEHAALLAAVAAAAVENSRVRAELAAALAAANSEQQRATAAERAGAIRELAAGLSRELNQVFAVVLGKSQLLRARTEHETVREGIADIEEAAWRGADVMHRLGALAAVDADPAHEATDLKALVQELVTAVRARADAEREPRPPIELVTDLAAVPPVRGSRSALREAIDAILRNAVDAMPAGGRLTVRLEPRDAGVDLLVADTGAGLDAEVRRRAFEPFFTTRAPERLGLGLTIAHVVATSCGGSLEISGRPASGAAVTMWLPFAGEAPGQQVLPSPVAGGGADRGLMTETLSGASRGAEPGASGSVAPESGASGSRAAGPAKGASRGAEPEASDSRAADQVACASVLLFEEDEPVRAMLVEALAHTGHHVDVAGEIDAGLARLERGSFGVVLADLGLPDRSGLVVARAVKRARPRTPVILITSWSPLLDPERLREHGVDLLLVKPFRPEKAVALVGEALRLYGSR